MQIKNNVSWITDKELNLLQSNANLSFLLGDAYSLDDILTGLDVRVIIEPGIVVQAVSPDLKKNRKHWEKEAEKLREKLKESDEREVYEEYEKVLRKIRELRDEEEACSTSVLRGRYKEDTWVIELYPDEMKQEYNGQRLEALLVSTLAHETMHAYFAREGRWPYARFVEEPLAEFGMLLFLHETNSPYYSWAFDDVKNKKSCYRYGANLMEQYQKTISMDPKSESPERRYLERYRFGLNTWAMPSVENGKVVLPSRATVAPRVTIEGRSKSIRWKPVYQYPPRFYFHEQTGTLYLDGWWGDVHIKEKTLTIASGDIIIFSLDVKYVYLEEHFATDINHRDSLLCQVPVYVSRMNLNYAEINNIPVYKDGYRPALEPCWDGLYKISRNGRWGVIDDKCNQVIPCEYDTIDIAGPNSYTVMKDGFEYCIDKNGNRAYTQEELDYQKEMLKKIYDDPLYCPVFHWNEEYYTEDLKDTIPYISIQDLLDYKYVICAIPDEKVEIPLMETERYTVVKEYASLDELVADGWRLD